MASAPKRPIIINEIERKRLLPDGLNTMIKARRRIEMERLAVNSILYKSSLLIPVFNYIVIITRFFLCWSFRLVKKHISRGNKILYKCMEMGFTKFGKKYFSVIIILLFDRDSIVTGSGLKPVYCIGSVSPG